MGVDRGRSGALLYKSTGSGGRCAGLNIEHPTSNFQHPTACGESEPWCESPSTLEVGSWMFDVQPRAGATTKAQHSHSTPSRSTSRHAASHPRIARIDIAMNSTQSAAPRYEYFDRNPDAHVVHPNTGWGTAHFSHAVALPVLALCDMFSIIAFVLFISAFFGSIAFAIRQEADGDGTE